MLLGAVLLLWLEPAFWMSGPARAGDYRFAIVLLDLDMPGMDGAASVETVVRDNRTGRVAILTAGTVDLRQSTLFASGAAGVILKSQPFADILAAIASILEGELYYPRADDRNLFRMSAAAAMVPVALRN